MIKNAYVVNSENWYWWMNTKEEAKKLIEKLRNDDNQKDIRFTYSTCKISSDDENEFEELKTLKVYTD